MSNMGLIDHPLTPLIVAWALAAVNRAAYDTGENSRAEIVARDALNAALGDIEELGDQIKARDAQLFVAEQQIKRLRSPPDYAAAGDLKDTGTALNAALEEELEKRGEEFLLEANERADHYHAENDELFKRAVAAETKLAATTPAVGGETMREHLYNILGAEMLAVGIMANEAQTLAVTDAALAAPPPSPLRGITDTMIEAGAKVHNPFAFDGDASMPLHRAQSKDEARKEVHAILSAALAAAPAVDATQGALALYLNEVQPVDGRVQINVSIDELAVLRHLAGAGEVFYFGTDPKALADRIIGIQEDLPDETDRAALGEVAHYLRKAAAPPASPLRGREFSENERHAVGHARYQVEHATPENPDCCFDYELVATLLSLIASPPEQPAAYPVAAADKEHADLLRRLAAVPKEEK